MNTSRRTLVIVALALLFESTLPAQMATPHSGIISLSKGPGANASCALLADRHVVCWGGLYRNGSLDTTPQQVANVVNASTVGVGGAFGCALLRSGTVSCWGNDANGQLGDGTTTSRSGAKPVGTRGDPFFNVTGISVGALHACGIRSGNVYCWGANDQSQLGNFNITADKSAVPVEVLIHDFFMNPPFASATSVSLGYYYSCAMQGSTAWCWGADDEGQLGDEASATGHVDGPHPVRKDAMPFGVIANSLSAGSAQACALLPDSSPNHVSCWGANAEGQLGNATASGNDGLGHPYNSSPSEVSFDGGGLLLNVSTVSAGGGFNCGLLADHTIRCWGFNDVGQLGDSHTTADHSSSPVGVYSAVGPLLGSAVPVVDVSTGSRHACALTSNSDVFCWGDNSQGQLGSTPGSPTSTPTLVPIDAPIFVDDFDGD
jgi:alpha-tubulin suppressor-like RCC1 family protein